MKTFNVKYISFGYCYHYKMPRIFSIYFVAGTFQTLLPTKLVSWKFYHLLSSAGDTSACYFFWFLRMSTPLFSFFEVIVCDDLHCLWVWYAFFCSTSIWMIPLFPALLLQKCRFLSHCLFRTISSNLDYSISNVWSKFSTLCVIIKKKKKERIRICGTISL